MVEQAAKKAVRAQLREVLRAMDPAELHRRSAAAADRLVSTVEFQRAAALMIFLPLPYEIDAQPIAIRAWQAGKTVTVPYVHHTQRHMLPLEINALDEPMHTDRIGVRTPRRRRPIPVDMIELVVVPGLGFDADGRRLGRGGGFYDRFLSRPDFHGMTCGLALEQQIVDRVPAAAHDVDLDMLVTDEQLLRFQRPATNDNQTPPAEPDAAPSRHNPRGDDNDHESQADPAAPSPERG